MISSVISNSSIIHNSLLLVAYFYKKITEKNASYAYIPLAMQWNVLIMLKLTAEPPMNIP